MREVKCKSFDEDKKQFVRSKLLENEYKNLVDERGFDVVWYTGLKDQDGVEIYESDLLNIYYTSSDGEHKHDCIYQAIIGVIGLKFIFERLLWENFGHNQFPTSTTLCQKYDSLDYGYFDEKNTAGLMVPNSQGENNLLKNTWKENDRTMWFKVIGNIHTDKELLED